MIAWWEKREQAILNASDWPALKAQEEAFDAAADRLRDCIIAYPARTIADVAAKVRFMGHFEFTDVMEDLTQTENMSLTELTFVGILADVDRLSQRGGAA